MENATVSSTVNAYIGRADLYLDEIGCLTVLLALEGDGWTSTVGGYSLKEDTKPDSPDKTGFFVKRLLEVFDKNWFSELKDLPCRVLVEDGEVRSIGHFLKECWFTPEVEMFPSTEEAS